MRRTGGFTLIELMIVVAVIGILSSVAVVAYTRYVRKARSAEVAQMFGELRAKEEAFHAEFGRYLGACPNPGGSAGVDCREGDFWPATLSGRGKATSIEGPLPSRWQRLRIQPGKGALYCQYEAVAGAGGSTAGMGPIGAELYGGVAPVSNWYYLLAQCDWDGDPTVNARYWQRGDLTVLGRENEQR